MIIKKQFGLQLQLFVGFSLLLLVGILLLGIFLLRQNQEQIENYRLQQAKQQVQILVDSSLDALVTQDYEVLERIVASVLVSDEYAYASLVSRYGQVISHSQLGLVGHMVSTPGELSGMKQRRVRHNGRSVIEVVFPAVVGGHRLANAHVAYYTDDDYNGFSRVVYRIAVLLVVALLMMGCGSYLLTRKVVSPIKSLINSISLTSLTEPVCVNSKILGRADEVGSLARCFSIMSQRLSDSFQKLQNKSEELERKVKERTKELSQSNQSLKLSEARISSIVENVADGIITFNSIGKIQSINSAGCSIFGCGADEYVGRNIADLIHKDHFHKLEQCLHAGWELAARVDLELEGIKCEQITFPMELTISRLKDHGISLYVGIVRDITNRHRMIERLRYAAEHDSLTGLYNRMYFLQELERTVARAHRGGFRKSALLCIDLDNFKHVNDTFGHAAGDQVLRVVASNLKLRSRDSDLIARLGGDEFAVLLYEVEPGQVEKIAGSFKDVLSGYTYRQGGKEISVGCSIGVALTEEKVASAKDLMAHGDHACYQAKRAGRNCVHVFDSNSSDDLNTFTMDYGWCRRIKAALDKNRFTLRYQPIVDIHSGDISSYEVLLRMLDDSGNLILPSGFLPAAERFGLTLQIDEWVIQSSIKKLKQTLSGNPNTRISINVTPNTVSSGKLCNMVKDALLQNNVEPGSITLEVVETTGIADLVAANQCLSELSAFGCQTALDDFGVGYATFSYLQELTVDIIKIDGRFVREIANQEVNQKIVKSVAEVAHAMGKTVVAECVEDKITSTLLKKLGVDFIQGYYVGREKADMTSNIPITTSM